MGKGAETCFCILKIEHLRIAVVSRIHILERRISIQHRLPGFHTIVLNQLSGNANPLSAFERADFRFRISQKLLGNILYFSGLNV